MSKMKPTRHNDLYDHNEEISVGEAIGLQMSGEEFTAKVMDFMERTADLESDSEFIEEACKTFTKKELALMWTSEITTEGQLPEELFRTLFMGTPGQV